MLFCQTHTDSQWLSRALKGYGTQQKPPSESPKFPPQKTLNPDLLLTNLKCLKLLYRARAPDSTFPREHPKSRSLKGVSIKYPLVAMVPN